MFDKLGSKTQFSSIDNYGYGKDVKWITNRLNQSINVIITTTTTIIIMLLLLSILLKFQHEYL